MNDLNTEHEKLKAEHAVLKAAYQKAQESIRDLLVTHRPHLMGNWVEKTAEDCGLKFDILGMIRVPNETGCTFPKELPNNMF